MLSELNYVLRYNKTLSTDQREHLKRTRDAFEESIGQLKSAFMHLDLKMVSI